MRDSSITALAQAVTVEDLEADPYPIYARLRREAPVCYIPAVGLWFVTRYDDVEFAASRPELFTAELGDSPVDRTFGSPTIITVDGERHQDLRRGLDSKYRPKRVNGYIDDLVRPIAESALDRLAGRDHAELMAEYFEPVSVLSLGTVLGIESLGVVRLRDWFWRLHQGVINFEGNPERQRIGVECSGEIDAVLGPVFDRLEAAGDDSTISHLLHSGRPAGAPVGALVSSACRDERRFADPDRFDIFRPRQANLAFGAGRHFCAGHAFSRAQIRIAIDVLLQRFPGLALDPARPPVFRGWEFRAPRNLDVILGS